MRAFQIPKLILRNLKGTHQDAQNGGNARLFAGGWVWFCLGSDGEKPPGLLSIKEISKYVFVVCFGFDPFDGKVIH